MKKKTGLAALLAAYALLLLALTAAESAHPDSSIKSIWDALWYSLVTITTVGYGDLYPVSPAGKVIALFFLLLSVGALALAVSLAYSALTGSLIPRLKLLMGRKKAWYVFSQVNTASLALAHDTAHQHPDSLIIFCNCGAEKPTDGLNAVCLPDAPGDVLPLGRGKKHIFLMDENALQNCSSALALSHSPAADTEIFCMGEENSAVPGVSFFDPFTCCARQYWQAHPLAQGESSILIAGHGRYAQALLSQAILANCRVPFAAAQYHLFGDFSAYRRQHPQLCRALAEGTSMQDALIFHDDPWNGDPALLEQADRIIFCADDEAENAQNACLLDRLYPHGASVYVRCANPAVPGARFGQPEALFTCETVLRRALDRTAMAMHETYRQSAGNSIPEWDALGHFTKASNRAAADHLFTKARLMLPGESALTPDVCQRAYASFLSGDDALRARCRENEHERWMRFHLLYNWQYAPVRDNAMRKHPSLIPFAQLSDSEKAKDDYAWMQLETLAGYEHTKER